MAKYKCNVCGYVYDEEAAKAPFSSLTQCQVCGTAKSSFSPLAADEEAGARREETAGELSYPAEFERHNTGERHMEDIHRMAVSGSSIIDAMSTKIALPSWEDILVLGAQLNPFPLDEHADVRTTTVIGKHARLPMVLESPVYISHMSFGALSAETKIALARGSAMAKTAMCSGEGGILPAEKNSAYRYIFEYVPNKYSTTTENFMTSDAIEIKIGQGTKPGMGGHLPGAKVTEEIARVRDKPVGQDVISPSRFEEIETKEDLAHVSLAPARYLRRAPHRHKAGRRTHREGSGICHFCGTGFHHYRRPRRRHRSQSQADPGCHQRSYRLCSLPRKNYLDKKHADIDLVITGGLRVSSDFAKALAMGADAVAIASAALIAAACQQYRICGTGKCPMGIATQDPELRKRFSLNAGAARVANYLNVTLEELKTFARITGHDDVHDLSVDDLSYGQR